MAKIRRDGKTRFKGICDDCLDLVEDDVRTSVYFEDLVGNRYPISTAPDNTIGTIVRVVEKIPGRAPEPDVLYYIPEINKYLCYDHKTMFEHERKF